MHLPVDQAVPDTFADQFLERPELCHPLVQGASLIHRHAPNRGRLVTGAAAGDWHVAGARAIAGNGQAVRIVSHGSRPFMWLVDQSRAGPAAVTDDAPPYHEA